MSQRINLIQEIVTIMERLEFKESSITNFIECPAIKSAIGYVPEMQKPLIIVYFHNLFARHTEMPPVEIRITLNGQQDQIGWISDMAGYVLPYTKVHEEVYYNN